MSYITRIIHFFFSKGLGYDLKQNDSFIHIIHAFMVEEDEWLMKMNLSMFACYVKGGVYHIWSEFKGLVAELHQDILCMYLNEEKNGRKEMKEWRGKERENLRIVLWF